MAQPVRTGYSVGAGQPIRAGRFPGGRLLATVTLAAAAVAGAFGVQQSALAGSIALDATSVAGTLDSAVPPDVFNSTAYALGVDSQGYLLGWPAAANVTSYSYSLDGGGTWTTRGTAQWALITGRTAGSTDTVIVRAFSASGVYADMPMSVTMLAGTVQSIFRAIGSGINPLTGSTAEYPDPQAWAMAGTTINGGDPSLVATNKKIVGLMLAQEWLNVIVAIGDGSGVGLPINTMTTSQACNRELTVFPGMSFCDHVGRSTNAVRYDATKGAAMRLQSSTSNPIIEQRAEAWSFVSRLQLSSRGTGVAPAYGGWGIHSSVPSPGRVFADRLLIESGTNQYVFSYNYSNHLITNSIAVQFRPLGQPTPETIVEEANGCLHVHCTIIAIGQQPAKAMTARMPETTWTNCALYGAAYLYDLTISGATGSPTFVGSMSGMQYYVDSGGAPHALPAGVTYSPLDAATFVSTAFGTGNYDVRPGPGSPLRAAAAYDPSYPSDIFYRRRPTTGGVDIGAVQAS